jgi:hypothetical protein
VRERTPDEGWLPSRRSVPATVHSKLLVAFLAIVVLLILVGVVGLQLLSGVNRRTEEMVTLERKIAAYRQLQHGTTAQLQCHVSSFGWGRTDLSGTCGSLTSSVTILTGPSLLLG